jgi:IS1 family transposase
LQLDEKWSFVAKKQARCHGQDPADHRKGDCWDHVAFDPEHRLVLAVSFGKRSGTRVLEVVERVKEQLQGRVPRLVTSDEFASYPQALRLAFGRERVEDRRPRLPSGKRIGAPPVPRRRVPPGLCYATVCKRRSNNGRIEQVTEELVYGTRRQLKRALAESAVSTHVNTSFLERYHATDRHRNARKGRRTYRFSKDWDVHAAVGYFTLYSYNFCWPVRTLRRRVGRGRGNNARYTPRTPAMSAGLSDHVWTLAQWLARPVPGLTS